MKEDSRNGTGTNEGEVSTKQMLIQYYSEGQRLRVEIEHDLFGIKEARRILTKFLIF